MTGLIENVRQGEPGWLILNNRESYLGVHRPLGARAAVYNAAMFACIATVVASAVHSTYVGLAQPVPD